MRSSSYLIFRLHGLSYAISAEQVKEIFLLPELTAIVDAPPDIIGLLDLHGRITPMMHLDLRFGHPFTGCNLNDSVIVLESQGLEIGVIVHQVETVVDIEQKSTQADLDYGRDREIDRVFVSGVAIVDREKIVVLDLDKLLRYQEQLTVLTTDDHQDLATKTSNSFFDLYCPEATSQERVIFRQRADNLQESTIQDEQQDLIAIAIFGLGGNYFGLELDIVREFIKIGKITQIPCCPNYIIGNMNLRGEILTLVDIHQILKLTDYRIEDNAKAVVFEVDDMVAGIVVDKVYDAIYLPPENLKPLPVALAPDANYLKATTTYLGQTLQLIDLPKILAQGLLTVDIAA
ncbi:MAG: chemotaxis protein CheW [Xenococcus sp. (in: cyanobacteria)]